jgi:hypothetical protein
VANLAAQIWKLLKPLHLPAGSQRVFKLAWMYFCIAVFEHSMAVDVVASFSVRNIFTFLGSDTRAH